MANLPDATDRSVLEAVLASLSDSVIVSDGGGALRYVNDAAVLLLGARDAAAARALSRGELTERLKLCDDGGAPFALAQLAGGARATIRWRSEPGGEPRWLLATAAPLMGTLVVYTLRDVTSLQRQQLELGALRAEVEELASESAQRARMVEQFVSVLGHDLRSPLAAISMAAALLEKTPLDDRGTRALLRIHTSTRRLERLIKDIVDFARARLGSGIHLQRTDDDLQDLSRQIIDELCRARPDRKVSLAVAGNPRGAWDFERLGQVLASMLANALKHSPASSDVRVEIEADEREARLLVHDEGEPIAATMIARVFEPFVKNEDGSGGRNDGLGLSVAADIVRAHGGSVEARSSIEAGTTMIAHLPR